MEPETHIGRRVREIRTYRGLSLTACAELSGMSKGNLSKIESGHLRVSRRATLEALAAALRVAPTELTDQEVTMRPGGDEARTATSDLRAALADNALGDPVDDRPAQPWHVTAALLHRLNTELRPTADYTAIGALLPELLPELHGVVATRSEHMEDALRGLLDCYGAAAYASKYLGAPDLASTAAFHARAAADRLESPAHVAFADLLRAQAVAQPARDRALALAERAANRVEPAVGLDDDAAQMFGMLHLTAALGSAALGKDDDSTAHEREAGEVARRVGAGTNFGNQNFGVPNFGFWTVTLSMERGEGGRAVELARDVDPSAVASHNRRAGFFMDLGRGLADERGQQERAVHAFEQAEEFAPQRFRANPYVRETVGDLLRRARRDAGGRELRGMAYRLGLGG